MAGNPGEGLCALRGVECKYSTASTAIHEERWSSWWRERGEGAPSLAANEPEPFFVSLMPHNEAVSFVAGYGQGCHPHFLHSLYLVSPRFERLVHQMEMSVLIGIQLDSK